MACSARAALAGILVGALALSDGGNAFAGAWTRAAGEGLVIVSSGRRLAPLGAFTGAAAETDLVTSQVYVEYGLRDGLTVGAKLYVELSNLEPARSSAALGGFLRRRLWRDGRGGVGSVELGYAHPVEGLFGDVMARADPGAVPEAHAAALYGRGWGGRWGSAFLSVGSAFFYRGGGRADEVRSEITAGYAPSKRWMGMLSLYGLAPLGAGSDPSLKIVPSIAYTRHPRSKPGADSGDRPPPPTTLQLSVSYDALNRDDGLGVAVSIWRPF